MDPDSKSELGPGQDSDLECTKNQAEQNLKPETMQEWYMNT